VNFRLLRPLPLAALAVPCAFADLSQPLPEWWSPPVPSLDAIARPDIGLAGQPESAPPIADQGVAGGAYTRAYLRMVPQTAHTDSYDWARRATRFGLETVVSLPGGWALGLDAVDDQIIHRIEGIDARWELAQPRGGLRIGAGANVLQTFVPDQSWVWGWSVWAPLLDRTGELEVQTGVRLGRKWRLDAAWATRLVRQKARRADSLLDTTTFRGQESRWSLRLGGQTAGGASAQVWGGVRLVEDPRDADDFRSTALASSSVFAGAQGAAGWRRWDLGWEVRADQGDDTLRTRASPSDSTRATVEHRMVAARTTLDAPWIGVVRPRLELSGAFFELSDGICQGAFPQLPEGVSTEGGGSLLRLGAAFETRVRTKWIDITPRAGMHRERLQGDLPQVWSGLWPLSAGSVWLGELGAGLSWKGVATRVGYDVAWLAPLGGGGGAEPGLSHRFDLYQGF